MVNVMVMDITVEIPKSSNLLTAKGDKVKKQSVKLILPYVTKRIVMLQSAFRKHLSRVGVIKSREARKELFLSRWVIKLQRYYLNHHHQTIYARRIFKGTIYGDKLFLENRINIIRNADNYPKKIQDLQYYLQRLEVTENKINNLPLSPEMVIIEEEEKLIEKNIKYHLNEIEELKLKIKNHHSSIEKYGDRKEKLKNQKLIVYADKYEEDCKKAEHGYAEAFVAWCASIGVPAVTANGDRNEDLYKAFNHTNPYVKPPNPADKLSRKPKKAVKKSSPKTITTKKSTGDKKEPKPKKCITVPADKRCKARKLFRDDTGQWGCWGQCKAISIEGDIVCKTHAKNNAEGLMGEAVPEKYHKDLKKPSKWFHYITETCDNAEENRKIIGLE